MEKIEGTYEGVWLNHFDELRAAYKTRPPSLSVLDLKDIYVDAENGEILKIEDTAIFENAHARVFKYAPKAEGIEITDLDLVPLTNLVRVKGKWSLSWRAFCGSNLLSALCLP